MDADRGLELLRKSVRAAISSERTLSVAYSGGLDSSILAAVAGECAKVHCYTCAVRGSFDAQNVRNRAASESLDLTVIELLEQEIPEMVRQASAVLATSNPTNLAYTIPVLVVVRESRDRLIMTGHGADELFGGYQKYVASPNPEQLMADDLKKMLQEARAMTVAASAVGKRIAFPFVSEQLMEFSRSLPLDRKINASGKKVLLRDVARMLNLPSSDLPKKAAQYSSGVLKEMKRQARSEGLSLSDWTSNLAGSSRRSA